MTDINLTALEAAVKALMGDNGAKILHELYLVVDAAETRGFTRGEASGYETGFNEGYDDGFLDGISDIEVPEEDLREPMDNRHVEGAPFTDMSEHHINAVDQSWVDAALEGAPADFVAPNRSLQSVEEREFWEEFYADPLAMQART